MAKLEITMRSTRAVKHLTTVAALAVNRGVAFIEDPATPGTAKLADGTQAIAGFITGPVTLTGPTLADAVYPGRTVLPLAAGDVGSFEDALEFEAEGLGEGLYSGTGMLTSGATVGSPVGFKTGLPRLAQSGEWVEYELRDKAVTPEDAGKLRCRFARVAGYFKA